MVKIDHGLPSRQVPKLETGSSGLPSRRARRVSSGQLKSGIVKALYSSHARAKPKADALSDLGQWPLRVSTRRVKVELLNHACLG